MLKSFLLMGLIIIKVIARSLSLNTVWRRIADRLWPYLTSFQNPQVLMVILAYYLIKVHLWQSSRLHDWPSQQHGFTSCHTHPLPCFSRTPSLIVLWMHRAAPSHPHTSARAFPLLWTVGEEDFSLPSLVQFFRAGELNRQEAD